MYPQFFEHVSIMLLCFHFTVYNAPTVPVSSSYHFLQLHLQSINAYNILFMQEIKSWYWHVFWYKYQVHLAECACLESVTLVNSCTDLVNEQLEKWSVQWRYVVFSSENRAPFKRATICNSRGVTSILYSPHTISIYPPVHYISNLFNWKKDTKGTNVMFIIPLLE